MDKINYKKLFSSMLWCSITVTCLAQAQGQTIERQMVFRDISPNTPIQRTVLAVTPVFSATCSAGIPDGELQMSINGKKKTITPSQRTMSLSGVAGIPAANGKNSYSYTILWKSSSSTSHQSITLNCIGKTVVTVPTAR